MQTSDPRFLTPQLSPPLDRGGEERLATSALNTHRLKAVKFRPAGSELRLNKGWEHIDLQGIEAGISPAALGKTITRFAAARPAGRDVSLPPAHRSATHSMPS